VLKIIVSALEAKVVNNGLILTEAQVQVLKKRLDDKACGEI